MIFKKANSTLAFLRHNLYRCYRNVKIHTYIRSILEYAITPWAPYTQQNINKIEHIQQQTARFIKSDF